MSVTREQKIRNLAYDLWEREGRPEGRHDAHWQQASRQLDEIDRAPASAENLAAMDAAAPLKPKRSPRKVAPVEQAVVKPPARRAPRTKPIL